MKVFDLDTGAALCDPSVGVEIIDLDTDEEIAVFIPGPPGPAGPGARPMKSGIVPGASFTGTPKKYAVVFTNPYDDTNYAIALGGEDSRSFTYESKATTGFTISANAGAVLSGEVSWITMTLGETS